MQMMDVRHNRQGLFMRGPASTNVFTQQVISTLDLSEKPIQSEDRVALFFERTSHSTLDFNKI